MEEKKPNVKLIVLLSAAFCAVIALFSLYQQSWQTMDVIIFMGQSNMSGAGGDASLAPELTEGAGYEYRAVTDPDNLYVLTEPFGENENSGALDDTDICERNGSLVTAFVNAYYEETGTPVVAISASRGSSSLNGWLNNGLKEEAASRLASAKQYLNSHKINARHIYMVWFQGEADANLQTTADEYKSGMKTIFNYMSEQGVEACFVIELGPDLTDLEKHAEIMEAQVQLCGESDDFVMVSTLPAALTDEEMKDEGGVHFTQEALNLIGDDAGSNAGAYVSGLSSSGDAEEDVEDEDEEK